VIEEILFILFYFLVLFMENDLILDLNLQNSIKKLVKGNHSLGVNVEAGHIYSDELVDFEQEKSLLVGNKVCEFILGLSEDIGLVKHLFVDNYHPQFYSNKEVLDISEYLNTCSNLGFDINVLTFEGMVELRLILKKKFWSVLRK